MAKSITKTSKVVPFSLKDTPSLIEKAWPTAKISAESQKERKATIGQTLTKLGPYWKGRKPLILTRACVLAALMPATDDLERDVKIFEKLAGMADESFGARFVGGPSSYSKMFPDHSDQLVVGSGRTLRWRDDLSDKERIEMIANSFNTLPYPERLDKVKRPEEIPESDLLSGVWGEVNEHLGTEAQSIQELVEQLGIMRFGRQPKFSDTFSGSGSIPFEAARMGCDVVASDLNPVACMLTWGSFNIVGSDTVKYAEMKRVHEQVVGDIDADITAMGIEHNSKGDRGKTYIYCLETRCPRTGYMVPLLPTRVLSSRGHDAIVDLVADHKNKRYDFKVRSGVSKDDIAEASKGTVRSGRIHHEVLGDPLGVSIKEIRGDFKDEDGFRGNRLRLWEKNDISPHPEDIWQERLYAILWVSGDDLKNGKANPKSWFAVPTQEDLDREEEVVQYVVRHLDHWQSEGLVPGMEIDPGYNTSQPIWERAWTHWHHLFNPRHLLLNAVVAGHAKKHPHTCLGLASLVDRNARTSRWVSSTGQTANTFSNQALNTMFNYPAIGWFYANYLFTLPKQAGQVGQAVTMQSDAKNCNVESDILVTDPPYADAVHYDEISEFFISWLRKNPPAPFDKWIWDSRRSIAIKGKGQPFKAAMIESYRTMTEHLSENGIQIVQFTHQDAGTWSDMAQIFWGAGLQVVQDWYVSTETMSELKQGGYVQGTHMIVLKKRRNEKSGYQDTIVHQIKDEVKRQIKEMIGLNDKLDAARGENIFNDADLQMAGCAAALRVLTAYTKIDGVDMTQEALRPRTKKRNTLVDELTEFAVRTANKFLVPDGLERNLWHELNGYERFYLKMMDIEEAGQAKLDQFQNFAKAFRVADYDNMMASKSPNNASLKTGINFGKSSMAEGTPFGRDSIVRLALRGVWRVAREDNVDHIIEELREMIPEYHRKREALRSIVSYVAAKREHTDTDEARAARILATAIRTERI